MRTNFPSSATRSCNRPARWPSASNPSLPLSKPIRRSHAFWLLPCLILFAGCAGLEEPRVVQTTVYACYQRPEWLQPTPEPAFQDKTVEELIEEARQLREALKSCNADKDKARRLIENQKPPPAAPGGTP